jgi:hypothetical protein
LSGFHRLGSALNPQQAERCERDCQQQPDDCALRLLLLGYYFIRSRVFEGDRRAFQRHVLWVIEHAPELARTGTPPLYLDPVEEAEVYEQAKRLWLRHVEVSPQNATILGNAARFFPFT